jgi:hypothetical protein
MAVIPKFKKPLHSLTQLEKEKAISKLRHETDELIDEMGQESDKKAVGVVREYVNELNEAEKEQEYQDIDLLKKYSISKKTYFRYLITILQRFILDEAIPKKYHLYCEANDMGIVVGINKTEFYGAFKVSGIPKYDINACKILAVQVGNTIAKLEGHVQTTNSGIVLPDSLDNKKYGRHR